VNDRNPTDYVSAAEAIRLMVLRGDGLTTTSIEILTGREIGIRLLGQRRVLITEPSRMHPDDVSDHPGFPGDADGVPAGAGELALHPGDELLVRRVSLTDAGATVYAVAESVAVLNRLPVTVATLLLTTQTPLGRALVASGVAVTRELRRWGGYQAGGFAAMLGPTLDAASVVAGRTYRMVSRATDAPLAVITEWFAPRLFEHAAGAESSSRAERVSRQHPPGD
jgi:chorismate-pyruvate lyase